VAPPGRAVGQRADTAPLVLPLAPARTLLTRLSDALAELLSAHRVSAQLIEAEQAQVLEHRLAATAQPQTWSA
jgi:hypothetical protein